MYEYEYPKSIGVGNGKLRFQLAGLCAAIAVVLVFVTMHFQTQDFLTSTPLETRAGRNYSQMWFDGNDALVGASFQGSKLTVEQWPDHSWQVDLGPAQSERAQWALAPDLSRVAWISGSAIYSRTLAGHEAPVRIALPAGKTPLALDVLSDGSIVAAFNDSSVDRWNDATGQALPSWHAPLNQPDQAVAREGYLALGSQHDRSIALYSFRARSIPNATGGDWIQNESAPAPDPPYRLLIPAPGAMATLAAFGLRSAGVTRSSPGTVRSVALHLYDLIVTGDFEGVYATPREGAYYKIADAPPGSLVAAGENHLAVSGRQGTTLLQFGIDQRLNESGRKLSYVSVLLTILAILLALGSIIVKGFSPRRKLLKRDSVDASIPLKLPDPPPSLIEACISGDAVLWAGAGLSAQAGFPLRDAFIAIVLQAASVDEAIDTATLRKLLGQCAHGNAEAALNELVRMMGSLRGELLAHYTSIFARFASRSRSHDLLTRLNLRNAITTNYDLLLEQTGEDWAASIATLKSGSLPANPEPFLLKLYGHMPSPATVLFSRAEWEAALAQSAGAQWLRRCLNTRRVFFLGCSLKGLLADLAAAGIEENAGAKHVAVAGVSESSWQKQAAELSRRYGIEVLACSADRIGPDLPLFLERLVREVEQKRKSPEPAAQASFVRDVDLS